MLSLFSLIFFLFICVFLSFVIRTLSSGYFVTVAVIHLYSLFLGSRADGYEIVPNCVFLSLRYRVQSLSTSYHIRLIFSVSLIINTSHIVSLFSSFHICIKLSSFLRTFQHGDNTLNQSLLLSMQSKSSTLSKRAPKIEARSTPSSIRRHLRRLWSWSPLSQ